MKEVSPTKAMMHNFRVQKPCSGQQFEPQNENETGQNTPEQQSEAERGGLLSKSLEPMTNRARLFINTKNNGDIKAAYNDNMSQSSTKNNLSQLPNMINVFSFIPACTEPGSTTEKKAKGVSKS